MKKFWKSRTRMVIIIIVLIGLTAFLFPKEIGRISCGPLCLTHGLHSYKQSCIGIEYRYNPTYCVDCSYSDLCFGIPTGEKKCYGISYTQLLAGQKSDTELDCNYPCNDNEVRIACQNQSLNLYGMPCSGLVAKCGW